MKTNFSAYKTVQGRHTSHAFKTAKIIVFDPHDVQKSRCALTRRAANMNQPNENRLTLISCNSSLAHITSTIKVINAAARLVRAHLNFCTSWGQTQSFLLF